MPTGRRRTAIPGTDLSVHPFCLGTGPFGDAIPEERAFDLMDRFRATGGNFVDTANVYGRWLPAGENVGEAILGRYLRARRASLGEDPLVIATKGAHPALSDMGRPRMRPADLRQDLEDSLRTLGLERIDLYWLHRDASSLPADAILEPLERFREEGKVRWIGCSNWRASRVAEARDAARKAGVPGFCAVQDRWSLAALNPGASPDPTLVAMDDDLYALHLETGLAAIPYSAQAGGYFAKRARDPATDPAADPAAMPRHLQAAHDNPLNDRRLHRLLEMARTLDTTVSRLSLAFLLAQPFPTIPIVGPRTPAQLADLDAALDLVLSDGDRDRLAAGRRF